MHGRVARVLRRHSHEEQSVEGVSVSLILY